MKRGGEDLRLAHQGGISVAARQHLNAWPTFYDAGRADEDHLQRSPGQGGLKRLDRRVDLASVGVALDHGIESGEARLCRMAYLAGQKNGPRTGAEHGLGLAKALELVEEVSLFEELEHGR